MSVVAPAGVHAAITAFVGNAITVSAMASDVVILRGLYLNRLGGAAGIEFQSGQTLHVEHCVLNGFSSFGGVYAHAPGADVYVKDTVARQNTTGFFFTSGGTPIRASLKSILAEENFNGVIASSNSIVTVTGGVAAGNENIGFSSGASTGVINLESCTATLNGHGVNSFGIARVADTMITGNTFGVSVTGAARFPLATIGSTATAPMAPSRPPLPSSNWWIFSKESKGDPMRRGGRFFSWALPAVCAQAQRTFVPANNGSDLNPLFPERVAPELL